MFGLFNIYIYIYIYIHIYIYIYTVVLIMFIVVWVLVCLICLGYYFIITINCLGVIYGNCNIDEDVNGIGLLMWIYALLLLCLDDILIYMC